MTREQLDELADSLGVELVILNGLDSAVIGFTYHNNSYRLIYSADKIVDVFIGYGMSKVDAQEWAEINVFQIYFGEKDPVISHNISKVLG